MKMITIRQRQYIHTLGSRGDRERRMIDDCIANHGLSDISGLSCSVAAKLIMALLYD